MKGQSDNNPTNFVKSNGKTQVNYNITSAQITDERGTRTLYNYDYVEIEGIVTRQKVIDAINKINNELNQATIIPEDIFTEVNTTNTNKQVIKDAYLNAITILKNIQSVTSPTNAQVIAAVKAEADILEKLLKFLKSQID